MNVLFVCSRNQWRSPTAEREFARTPHVATRSAGTARAAKRRITLGDIRWADLILVMEEKHKSRIVAEFRADTRYKQIRVLNIPDDYLYMDVELIAILREKVTPLIEQFPDSR